MATIVAWIVVLGVLVAIHELGHYFVAKGFGMGVDEYSIGFGPALWKRRWRGTLYALRVVPLGGYVRLAGMDPNVEANARDFPNRALWQRFLVIFAGPVMNLILAMVLYALALGAVGVPVATTTVANTLSGYPAAQAGIRPGDRIVSVDGRPVPTWTALDQSIKAHQNQLMVIGVESNHHVRQIRIRTRYDAAVHQHLIGIRPAATGLRLGPLSSLSTGVSTTVQLTGSWFVALVHLVEGQKGVPVQGPVGIAQDVGIALQGGAYYLFLLAAALSANLGLFNILPFPVLDGSRLFFLGLEGVRKKKMDPDHESLIYLVGMVILLLFVIIVTFHDVASLISHRLSS
ncbi:MAG: M50 family metallopeptidase [Firmicutes bacterium]|jgi:regulator of sigma E protease|nr:M50 family metallopeptidase [Bacillota bacterium]